ncbi:MAG: 2-oxoacid:acceptor oxidoreductase subunit alpha [Candidatus Woesearchaeota archaeon]
MTKKMMQGSQAVAEGAIAAGLTFFAGYPITPATEILNALIRRKEVKAFQFEDEIASANAIIGASMAGAKSMTATSGPGFSLMQESIGLAAMTRTPVVIVNVMRVGPSTGMPTMAAQGDIMQSRFGSHGDYFPIVFYPNSASEIYTTTIHAFNAAEELQGPVILLLDALISNLYETFEAPVIDIVPRKRKPMGTVGNRHLTGLVSEDGIPKTQDAGIYKEIIHDMQNAQEETAAKHALYEYIKKDSDTLLIAFGATSRLLSDIGQHSIFRPIRMFPVIDELKSIASKYKKIVVIEMNTGQYSQVIGQFLKRDVTTIPLLGGNIHLEEIRDGLSRLH